MAGTEWWHASLGVRPVDYGPLRQVGLRSPTNGPFRFGVAGGVSRDAVTLVRSYVVGQAGSGTQQRYGTNREERLGATGLAGELWSGGSGRFA